MDEVFFGPSSDKDDLFEECIHDPLTDVSSTIWPFISDLPCQSSSLPRGPSAIIGTSGSKQLSDEESGQAPTGRLVTGSKSGPAATTEVSSEGSLADASDHTSTPAAFSRKRGSEVYSGPAQKVRVKQRTQPENVEQQANSLMQACQALQACNRMLESTARTACALSSELCSLQGTQAAVHESLLKGMMAPYAAALSWPDLTTTPILGVLTLEIFISGILPNYLEHLRKLLETGGWEASSAPGQQIVTLVHQRRQAEDRVALSTKWAGMLLAWNQQEGATLNKPPSTAFHTSLLAGLRPSQRQVQELVAARRRLLAALLSVQERREAAIMAMGLALLQPPPQGEPGSVPAASIPLGDIQQTLEEERLAVATFLHTCTDQVLTPAQQAYLDCQAHPWCPDLWALAGLLAESQPGEPSRAAEAALLPSGDAAPAEGGGGSVKDRAKSVSLHMGAFGMLRAPLLGRGAGLSLKRLITLQSSASAPLQSGQDRSLTTLRNTKLLEAFAGRTTPLPSRATVTSNSTNSRGASGGSHRGNPCKALEQQCLQRLAPPTRPYPSVARAS